MLNLLWMGFFLIAFIACAIQALAGDVAIFSQVMNAVFSMAELSVKIAIGLVGVLCFWLGMMRIAEHSGLISKLAKILSPLFARLMPEVPKGDKAVGSVTMNLAANLLGLDNAATPLGIKAMHDLQAINPDKTRASNAQILFLVLNTSSVTLFPVTVFLYRAQQGAVNPTDVFIPILLATSASTLVGLLAVAWMQKLRLRDWVMVAYAAAAGAVLLAMLAVVTSQGLARMADLSAALANFILLSMITALLLYAYSRRVKVYESFVEGAKEGFELAVMLIPYLVAMLVAIGVFRASGALDLILDGVRFALPAGADARFVDALPTALMKPFSGSGARAMMVETMNTYGADSFAGRLASVMQGSTETTFYVLAVYFGAVGIRHYRHAIGCGLAADLGGMVAAIGVCYWFFG